MSKRFIRLACALLAAILLAVASGPAWAAEKKKTKSFKQINGTLAYVYTYAMQVYEKPNVNSAIVETVPFAKPIMRIEVKKGWAQVYTTNHVMGYCNADLLTTTNPNRYNTKMYAQQHDLPVYRWPSISASLIDYMDRDEAVTMVAMTPLGDWLRVKKGDKYGYIQKPRLDYSKYSKGKDAWCMADSLVVYYDPDLDTEIGTIYFGQHVRLVSKSNGWAKVRSPGGFIGYCDAGSLSTVNPNTLNYTVYTQAEGNFMFLSSTDLSGRRQLGINEPMTLLAVDSNQFWARVQFDKTIYYIPYVFLGTEKRLGDYKVVTARAGVNIREGTKKSSAIVVTVPTGTQMYLIGATDNRAKVTTLPDSKGKTYTGFVELQYLK